MTEKKSPPPYLIFKNYFVFFKHSRENRKVEERKSSFHLLSSEFYKISVILEGNPYCLEISCFLYYILGASSL